MNNWTMKKVCAGALMMACCAGAAPKPVIISTDIGDDIDDTWRSRWH